MEQYSLVRCALVCFVFIAQSEGTENAASSFNTIVSDFWEWRLELSPSFATAVGNFRYNDRLENTNWRQLIHTNEKCTSFSGNLTQIDRRELSSPDQVSYDILHDFLKTYTDGYSWWRQCGLHQFNFLDGIQVETSFLLSATPQNTIGDIMNYLARLQAYPGTLDDMVDRMRESLNPPKFVYNNVSVDRVPSQIDAMQVPDPKWSPLFKPFNETLQKLVDDGIITEQFQLETMTSASNATRDLLNKFIEIKTFLQNEYMPNTRTGYGLANFGDTGKLLYKASLKWHTSTDMTAGEIHQIGLDEVARISGQMQEVMDKLGHQGTIKSFFDKLEDDDRFHRNTSEELTAMYEELISTATSKLPPLFDDYPGLPVRVVEMVNDGPGGSYSEGSEDGSRPGTFYVNNLRPWETPLFDMPALTLHETVPGHHLQIGNYQMKATLPKFRKHTSYNMMNPPMAFPAYTAYVEGWALYAEFLGEEMGMYRDDYELMGRYGSEIFRACRLVVDTGLHDLSWSREQAIEYMLKYTAYSRPAMEVEIDRYCTWPGQATAYKIGELKIKALRETAEKELGDQFDIKGFHGAVLNNGPVPLSILDTLVKEWIQSVKSTQPSRANSNTGTVIHIVLAFMSYLLSFI